MARFRPLLRLSSETGSIVAAGILVASVLGAPGNFGEAWVHLSAGAASFAYLLWAAFSCRRDATR